MSGFSIGSKFRYGTPDRVYEPIYINGEITKVKTYIPRGKKRLANGSVQHYLKASFSYQKLDEVKVLWEKVGLVRSKILGFKLETENRKVNLKVLVQEKARGIQNSYYVPVESLQVGYRS